MRMILDVAPSKTRVDKVCSCGSCKLKKTGKTEFKGKITGKGKKKILIVMSNAEVCEDDAGKHWGTSDDNSAKFINTIKSAFKKTDIDYLNDCWRVDAVQCCPRHTAKAHKQVLASVDACRPTLLSQIEQLKPTVILAFGSAAVSTLYGHRTRKYTTAIDSWHGFVIPDKTLNAWVIPCYGVQTLASFTHQKNGEVREKETYKLVAREIARVLQLAEKYHTSTDIPDFYGKAKATVHVCPTVKNAVFNLKKITEGDSVSIDYEASGIKPDYSNQFIKCAAIYSHRLKKAFSFMMDCREKEHDPIRKEWKRILTDKTIDKIGQNSKFEERWTRRRLGYKIKGWTWDSMLASHTLYNARKSVTGLKFQTTVNFGVEDYNGGVEHHFKAVSGNFHKGANRLNQIDAIAPDVLLKYNGLDTVFNYWLYLRQKKVLQKWQNSLPGGTSHIGGLKFLLESSMTLADMEEFGAKIDVDYLNEQKEKCIVEIRKLEKEFDGTALYKKWRASFAKVNLSSNKQLSHILYKVLGLSQKKKTESGEDSTDKEALLSLGLPDLAPFFRMKLLQKAAGTYIAQITREVYETFLHASFNLHIPATFRSSSSDPNQQNVPIRNKDIGIIIRGAYKSRHGKDGVLFEADLKGAEVSISACYHKDKNFIRYITDPENDMHKDTMGLIMAAPPEMIGKDLRNVGKSSFVFPEFYGDWYASCAEDIWGKIQSMKMTDGTPSLLHLQNVGVIELPRKWKEGQFLIPEMHPKVYQSFEDHMQEVEHKFWFEMFPEYTEWKEQWWQKYLELGYVDTFTGFRLTGFMDKKKTGNYPIQGDAYHVSQHGINIVNKRLRFEKMLTRIFNQIHDSGIYDSVVSEYKDVIKMINHVMNVEMRKIYPWINVPIVIEFDATLPGESWFHKKAFDLNTMDFAKK